MADERRIQIGVSGADEAISQFTRIRREATGYFEEMIRASRNYTTSGREVSLDLERQIRSLERRRNLEIENRAESARSMYRDQGNLTPALNSSITERASKERSETRQVVGAIRELIEVTRDTSRQEIRENRNSVERTVGGSSTVNRLNPQIAPELALRETLQRQMLGDIREDESKEKDKFWGSAKDKPNQVMGAIAGAKNEFALLAGALAAIPFVGAGVAALAGRALNAAEGYQKSYSSARGQTGMGWEGFGAGGESMGITMESAIGEGSALSRVRGGKYGRANAINSLMMQRGMGLGQGDVHGIERTLRGSDTAGIDVVTGMTSGLEKSGAIAKGDYSLVPEYLRILTQVSQEQLNTLGKVDVGVNEKMVLGLSQLDESFKNPDVLQGVMNSIRGGLSSASTPQAEALQYSVLSKMNPNASWFQIQKMKEAPTTEYLQNTLGELKKMSGGENDEYFTNIMGMFNTSASIAEKIGSGDLSSLLVGTPDGKGLKKQLPGKAVGATSTIDEANAKFQNLFAGEGDKFVLKIDEYIKELQEWLKDNKTTLENTASFLETLAKYGTPQGLMVTIAEKASGAGKNIVGWVKENILD